jgi:LPS export ABC transporter protein LptC
MKRWALILAVTSALLAAACENDPQEVDALSRKVIEVEEGKNIEAIFSQSASLKAILKAPLMNRVKDDTLYVEFPKSLYVEFFDEEEKLQNVVKARYARYFESQGLVFLRDSVMVYNIAGDTLHCKTLWWNQSQEIFYTDDSVVINTPMQQLRGTGFWAKSDFTKYTIRNTIGTVVIPEEARADSSGTDSAKAVRKPF